MACDWLAAARLTTGHGQGEFTMAQSPNQYHLEGRGITVSYFPQGEGPVFPDRGRLRLTYQDAHQSRAFFDADVRTVDVEDLGTVVSVTLILTVDTGSTTFSLLIPQVDLPDQPQPSVFIRTEGITTVHRAFVGLIGHPQAETYTVTALHGTASVGVLAA
jgi:hypothetical protein